MQFDRANKGRQQSIDLVYSQTKYNKRTKNKTKRRKLAVSIALFRHEQLYWASNI
ncbi:MAG: hypothetical protein ACJ71F_11765 [Nitrososphaeraceae archaeon]